MPGTQRLVVGRYRLLHPLAEGGFGRVWKAHDERLRADVVVKEVRLPPTADADEQAKRLAYAEREARNAARLRHHPGVVPVYDVAIEDGRPWIVMQLVDGGSLEERLREGPLPVDEAVELADALLQALDAAHGANVVHRDVKPANIMMASDGRILLTDFGIATHPADTRLTMDGSVIGSLEYMAPERLSGDPGAPAPAGDLFSLGVTLYQAVEGTSPFRRDSYPATMAAIAGESPAPPRRAGRLAPLIRALLAKDPAARPTVSEALALLHRPAKKKRKAPEKEKTPATTLITPTDSQPTHVFEESWTGDEDPREFGKDVPVWPAFFIFGGLGIALLIACWREDWKGDTLREVFCYALVLLFLVIAIYGLEPSSRALRKRMRDRTLRIGQDGITTTDSSGVQHIPWSAIGKVAVRYTDTAVHNYRPLALHLRMHPTGPEAPTVLHRPAGWPADADLPAVCRGPQRPAWNDWIPVCVLGPLLGPLRLDLKNAIAAYAKHPLETEGDW